MTEQKDFSDLTIISPTLNEEQNIPELLRVLTEIYTGASIIIADDGSKDRTAEIVRDWIIKNPKIKLLDRSAKPVKGLTASVMEAIQEAETKYFLVIDADLQHPPLLIKDLYDLARNGTKIVAGVRKPYQENQGWHRIVITKSATLLAKLYLKIVKGLIVSDPMSGFFLSNSQDCQKLIKEHELRFEPLGYKVFFDLLKIFPKDTSYQEIQYQFSFRTNGKSKLSPKHAFYFLRGLLK